MTLRNLPEIQSFALPSVCAFSPDTDALGRWDAGVMAADNDENTISVLDVIGDDPWTGGGVSSKRIAGALRAIGQRDVVVNINSPGGDFFEGVAIYNLLRAHPHKVTVRVLGMAASAASVIAMAGDEVQIGKAGFLMVHNAWVVAIGNRHDMREAAETMEPFDDAMATLYAERAGVQKSKAVAWMDAETWFNGEQAVDAGLADSYLPADEVQRDNARADAHDKIKAVKVVDTILAKEGLPRSERNELLAGVKGTMRDASASATRDAGEIAALIGGLRSTLST